MLPILVLVLKSIFAEEINFNDLTSYDSVKKINIENSFIKEPDVNALGNYGEQICQNTFRQIANELLKGFKNDSNRIYLNLSYVVQPSTINILHKFLGSSPTLNEWNQSAKPLNYSTKDNANILFEISEFLLSIIKTSVISSNQSVWTPTSPISNKWLSHSILANLGFSIEILLFILFVIIIILQCFLVVRNWNVSILRIFQIFLAISIFVSIPWNWILLYQETLINNQHLLDEIQNTDALECKFKDKWFLNLFDLSFLKPKIIKSQSQLCLDRKRAAYIHPILTLNPIKVLIITLTRTFIEPLNHIGGAINSLFRHVFEELPLLHTFIVTAVFCLFVFICLIFIFRYTIRFPWFFSTIEPTSNFKLHQTQKGAIGDNYQQLMETPDNKLQFRTTNYFERTLQNNVGPIQSLTQLHENTPPQTPARQICSDGTLYHKKIQTMQNKMNSLEDQLSFERKRNQIREKVFRTSIKWNRHNLDNFEKTTPKKYRISESNENFIKETSDRVNYNSTHKNLRKRTSTSLSHLIE